MKYMQDECARMNDTLEMQSEKINKFIREVEILFTQFFTDKTIW